MLDLLVIELSVSPCSSPILLVPKKGGSVLFCIDFRKLNKVPEFDAKYGEGDKCRIINTFQKLDLSKCYLQVELTDKSKPLITFETPRVLFHLKLCRSGL